MNTLFAVIAAAGLLAFLAYHRLPALVWTIAIAIGLFVLSAYSGWPSVVLALLWLVFLAGAVVCNPTRVRREHISRPLLAVFRRILPQVSQTEQDAIEAGTVWWEGELFSGDPAWDKLLGYPRPVLSDEERAFLDGPVEALCHMLNDWQVSHELLDLPTDAWQFIKDNGFLGLIIPKQYGGLGFSALAHSEVVMKLTTRGSAAAITVMVPNSLGPAELLLHYGTPAQKDHYLPRLARGLEIPCFALTSPEAGSDAGAIPDFGVVCRGEWEGNTGVLGIRLTWEKRYITLAPVATLVGLAFRLYDPDHLLGEADDLGITLALIPTQTPGVHVGRRHFPLGAAFMNGPTWGKDVFLPMEHVIGGVEYAGQGWRMLMNSLAAGRSISLPANSCGIAKVCALTTGAYGRVRQQFRLSIGRFEGVEEAIARIAGNTYIMEAARVMTAGAVDLGEKPAVVSAIVKYHLTERSRQTINDAMDVHGGKGICMGPSNYLAQCYQQQPIAITVEGANILTRSMIIFGQGAIRGHPYVLKEIAAAGESDPDRAVREFDAAFFGHLLFTASNAVRAVWLAITSAWLVWVPGEPPVRRYFQKMSRLSAAFALVSDITMLTVGGSLKRRERLSARLGDVLSQLYLACAAIKFFEDHGRPEADRPLLDWSVRDALYKAEDAFFGLFANLPNRALGSILKWLLFPYGRAFPPPSDELGHRVVSLLIEPTDTRKRLAAGVFVSRNENDPVATLEAAFVAVIAAEPIGARIRAAREEGAIVGRFPAEIMEEALAKGVVTAEEKLVMERARALRRRAIMVDDFPHDLGRTEIYQTTQPVTTETLHGRIR